MKVRNVDVGVFLSDTQLIFKLSNGSEVNRRLGTQIDETYCFRQVPGKPTSTHYFRNNSWYWGGNTKAENIKKWISAQGHDDLHIFTMKMKDKRFTHRLTVDNCESYECLTQGESVNISTLGLIHTSAREDNFALTRIDWGRWWHPTHWWPVMCLP